MAAAKVAADKEAARKEKEREVAYVRQEKQEDALLHQKLTAMYGSGPKRSSDTVHTRAWLCEECRLRNYDSRNVCGGCLAPNPAALSVEKQMVNSCIPLTSTADQEVVLLPVGGRIYRTFFTGSAMTSGVPNRRRRQMERLRAAAGATQQHEDPNEEDAADDGPSCAYSAFAVDRQGGLGVDDEEDAPCDGPNVVCRATLREEPEDESMYEIVDEEGVAVRRLKQTVDAVKYQAQQQARKQEREKQQLAAAAAAAAAAAPTPALAPGVSYDATRRAFVAAMPVPQRFWKFIIGAKGRTLQDIQRLTGATVILPKTDDKKATAPAVGSAAAAAANAAWGAEDITVTGPQQTSVLAALKRIEDIMADAQDKVDYTHFISIPICTATPSTGTSSSSTTISTRGAFAAFLRDVQKACVSDERRIEPSMIQSADRLHLTLLMLRLHERERVDTARALLDAVQQIAAELFPSKREATATFKGLNFMNDDPEEVHVVYLDLARDTTYQRLVQLVQRTNQLFIDAGLATERDVAHNEKLHVTVVNSKWRTGAADDGMATTAASARGAQAPRVPFDATDLLRVFGSTGDRLPTVVLERVDLSMLGAPAASDGYFRSDASVPLHR
jgi:hypothetical protein